MEKWRSIEKEIPDIGTLCEVFFPIGGLATGELIGPRAIAYKTESGWTMADIPGSLRGALRLGPAYWRPMDKVCMKDLTKKGDIKS